MRPSSVFISSTIGGFQEGLADESTRLWKLEILEQMLKNTDVQGLLLVVPREPMELLREHIDTYLDDPSGEAERWSRVWASFEVLVVLEQAAAWFQQQLAADAGAGARSYLKGRGLDEATVRRGQAGTAQPAVGKTGVAVLGLDDPPLLGRGPRQVRFQSVDVTDDRSRGAFPRDLGFELEGQATGVEAGRRLERSPRRDQCGSGDSPPGR